MFTKETIVPAWRVALSKRTIDKPLIFHLDRSVQYVSKEFRKQLKSELIYHNDYKTIEKAEKEMFEYIETWYNTKRQHSSLNYKTPKEIELEFMNIKNAA